MAQTPLYDRDYPLVIRPRMAVAIGLGPAIVLQQLIYLLNNTESGKVLKDGHRYVFNTYPVWRKRYFPFWSIPTIQRLFAELEERSLLASCQPEGRISRRKYYRVCDGALAHLTYERLEEAEKDLKKLEGKKGSRSYQNDTIGTYQNDMIRSISNCDLPITETTQRKTTETPLSKPSKPCSLSEKLSEPEITYGFYRKAGEGRYEDLDGNPFKPTATQRGLLDAAEGGKMRFSVRCRK